MFSTRSILACLSLALPALAQAAPATAAALDNYVGVQFGTAKIAFSCGGATPCSRVNNSVFVRVGHRFSPQWALELSGVDVPKGFFPENDSEAAVDAWAVSAALTQPLGADWNAVARLGLARSSVRYRAGVPAFQSSNPWVHADSVGPQLGLGVAWQCARRWSLNLDADWVRADLRKAKSAAASGTTVRYLGAGAAFHF